jgi:hypothetical protein
VATKQHGKTAGLPADLLERVTSTLKAVNRDLAELEKILREASAKAAKS